MKPFLLSLLVIVLTFASCSQDYNIEPDEFSEIPTHKRTNAECIDIVKCDEDYEFCTVDPHQDYYCFTITYESTLSVEEVNCVRHAYFSCFYYLCLSTDQPVNPSLESWCFPIDTGKPLKSLSKTIISDPRIGLGIGEHFDDF